MGNLVSPGGLLSTTLTAVPFPRSRAECNTARPAVQQNKPDTVLLQTQILLIIDGFSFTSESIF